MSALIVPPLVNLPLRKELLKPIEKTVDNFYLLLLVLPLRVL